MVRISSTTVSAPEKKKKRCVCFLRFVFDLQTHETYRRQQPECAQNTNGGSPFSPESVGSVLYISESGKSKSSDGFVAKRHARRAATLTTTPTRATVLSPSAM